jgi:hypothetical protein
MEALDDITDGEFDAARMGMPAAQALVAGSACLSLIPQKAAKFYAPPARLAAAWGSEPTQPQVPGIAGERFLRWRGALSYRGAFLPNSDSRFPQLENAPRQR